MFNLKKMMMMNKDFWDDTRCLVFGFLDDTKCMVFGFLSLVGWWICWFGIVSSLTDNVCIGPIVPPPYVSSLFPLASLSCFVGKSNLRLETKRKKESEYQMMEKKIKLTMLCVTAIDGVEIGLKLWKLVGKEVNPRWQWLNRLAWIHLKRTPYVAGNWYNVPDNRDQATRMSEPV